MVAMVARLSRSGLKRDSGSSFFPPGDVEWGADEGRLVSVGEDEVVENSGRGPLVTAVRMALLAVKRVVSSS